MNDLINWINQQIETRGWTYADISRRGGISKSAISYVINGQTKPGTDLCLALARAFNEAPENIFRLAGILPKLPPAVEEEREAVGILRQLPAATRQNALTMLRALAGGPAPVPVVTLAAPATPYNSDPLAEDQLERDLLTEFRKLPDEWQQEALREVERLKRYSALHVRIIGDETEEQTENAQRHEPEIRQ